MAGSYTLAIPEAKDDARGHAKIILAAHVAGRVCIRGAQIISSEANRKRPRNGAFDPTPDCIGGPRHPSLHVFGTGHRDCTINQSRADQRVHEHLRLPGLKQMKYGASKEG